MAYEKPNYTQAPNAFFDEHLGDIKSLAELKVSLVVFRNTIGWHEDSVDMTLSELMKATKMCRPSVMEGVSLALQRGTIIRHKKGRSFTYEGNITSVKNVNRSQRQLGKDSLPISVKKVYRSPDESLLRKEKKETKQGKPLRDPEPLLEPPFHGKDFLRVLKDFAAYSKSIHRPLTEERLKYLYPDLVARGEKAATAAMSEAMRRGWNGLSENTNGNSDYRDPVKEIKDPVAEAKRINCRLCNGTGTCHVPDPRTPNNPHRKIAMNCNHEEVETA